MAAVSHRASILENEISKGGGLRGLNRESFIPFVIAMLMTTLAALYFHIVGYPLVNTFNETLNLVTPPIYMLPIFIPYGFLLGDALILWLTNRQGESFLEFTFLAIIGGLSFFRLLTAIPMSGHAIILSYYLLMECLSKDKRSIFRILVGIGVLFVTLLYKLAVWKDPLTFLTGFIVGSVVWIIGYSFSRITNKHES